MRMRRVFLAASILLSLMLVGIVFAEQLDRESALRWSTPDWERTYVEIVSDYPITPTLFSLTGTVRLIDSAGVVVDSQSIQFSGCEPGETPGSGQCGSAYSWSWETDNYAKGKGILTEQIKIAWIADPNIELVGPYVPTTCNLAGAGCTIEFDQATWTLSIPQSCRDALEGCGTVQDEDGWWKVSTFQGTRTWTWCLPSAVVGDIQ